MKLEALSIDAQDGLRLLGKQWENDELLFDALASNATEMGVVVVPAARDGGQARMVSKGEMGYPAADRATFSGRGQAICYRPIPLTFGMRPSSAPSRAPGLPEPPAGNRGRVGNPGVNTHETNNRSA